MVTKQSVWALWHSNWKLTLPFCPPLHGKSTRKAKRWINWDAWMEFPLIILLVKWNLLQVSTWMDSAPITTIPVYVDRLWEFCSRLSHLDMDMPFISKAPSSYINAMFSIIYFCSRGQTLLRKRAKRLHGYFYISSLSLCWRMIFDLHPAHSLLCTEFQIHRFLRELSLPTS